MPEDRILEDPLDLSADFLTLDTGPDLPDLSAAQEGPAQNTTPADRGPEPRRIAEPEYPRAAQRRKIRAEITVLVTIDPKGQVTDQEIMSRHLLEDNGQSRREVESLGYGLEEAAVSAAARWMFRPARKQGEAVHSQYTLTVKFGV